MVQPNYAQQPMPIQPAVAQQGTPGGANAVSINIYNPQAYGSTGQATAGVPDMQQNSAYAMPQVQTYGMPQASVYPQMQPEYEMMQPPMYQPMQQYPMPPLMTPAPQTMPQSVMDPNAQQAAPVENNQPSNIATEQPSETVNVDGITEGLKNPDADQKAQAINQIAAYAQEKPEVALQLVSEPVMKGLVDVINEDTTALEGPTDKQIEIAQKINNGEQLTPEEEKLSEELSPRDKANKNRIFALYTLAMLQKLQRDELDQYIENQKANGGEAIQPLQLNELIGYNDIVNIINNDPRPEVKTAAIQALGHIANPLNQGDVAEVSAALQNSLNSEDEAIKNAATETLAKFQGGVAPAEGEQQAQEKPADENKAS